MDVGNQFRNPGGEASGGLTDELETGANPLDNYTPDQLRDALKRNKTALEHAKQNPDDYREEDVARLAKVIVDIENRLTDLTGPKA